MMTLLRDATIHDQINNLNDQAWQAFDDNQMELGLQLGQNALSLALGCHFDSGIAHSYIVLAEYAREAGQYQQAIQYFQKSGEYYVHLEHDLWLIRGFAVYGTAWTHLGDYAAALEGYQEQLHIADELNSELGRALALRRIGVIYGVRGDLEKSMRYHEDAEAIYKRLHHKVGLGNIYGNLCILYRHQGKLEQALSVGLKALEYYSETKQVNSRSLIQGNLAIVYALLGDHEQAFTQSVECHQYAQLSGQHHTRVLAHKNRGEIYKIFNQLDLSQEQLHQALALAKKADDKYEMSLCHELLATIYELQAKPRLALEHYKEFHHLHELLRSETKQVRFQTLEVMYQTEQARQEADRMSRLRDDDRQYFQKLEQLRKELMDTTTHDLKSPLSTIRLATYLIRREPENIEKTQDIIRMIRVSVRKMRRLLSNLWDLATIEAHRVLDFQHTLLIDLVNLSAEAYHLQAENRHMTIAIEGDNKAWVFCDRSFMQQVMDNLVSNAIKYTKSGGTITITIEDRVTEVAIHVKDDGIGIPTEALPYIFDRFYRVDNQQHRIIEGTGLGLAICKRIIEQHGGMISVDSIEGQGTTFSFVLPKMKLIHTSGEFTL